MNVRVFWLWCTLATSELAFSRSKDVVEGFTEASVADTGIVLHGATPAINCEQHGGVISGKSCKLPVKTTAPSFEVSEDESFIPEDLFHNEEFHRAYIPVRSMFLQIYRDYHRFLENVYNVLESRYENINISESCAGHVKLLKKLVQENDLAARKFIDSTGKPQSNTLEGGVSYLGSFSQCLKAEIHWDKDSSIGKYCLARLSVINKTDFPKGIAGISTIRNAKPAIGLCVPSSCTTGDVMAAVNGSLLALARKINVSISCQTKERIPLDSNANWMICAIILLVVLSFTDPIHERLKRKQTERTDDVPLQTFSPRDVLNSPGENPAENDPLNDQPAAEIVNDPDAIRPASNMSSGLELSEVRPTYSGCKTILMAFSVERNLTEIFDLKSKEDSIECVDGLRLISMIVIIFNHTFTFATVALFFRNPQNVNDVGGTFLYFFMSLATLAVDSFYFISGLVICYAAFKKIQAGINAMDSFLFWLNFVTRRYFRLTPILMALIAFSVTLLHYTSSGPNFAESIRMYNSWCEGNWWRNLFHVQNLWRTEHMCFAHSWYIATDMQFSFLAPLVIVGLHKSPRISISLVTLTCIGSMIITGVLTDLKNYPALPYFTGRDVPKEVMAMYYGEIYMMPHTRIGTYLIGMLMGYFLIKKPTGVISKVKQVVTSVAGAVTVLAVLSHMYYVTGNEISRSHAAAFGALARPAFVSGLGMLVLGCHYRYQGLCTLNSLVSWKYLKPWSRLTYAAYLVHPVLMDSYYGSFETDFNYSTGMLVLLFSSFLMMTYVLSPLLVIFVEYPFRNLGNLLVKAPGPD